MQFIQSTGENTVINLSGKLDFATAGVFMEELKTLVGKGVKRIDIHCADLEFISSAGIRSMVFLKQKIDKNVEVDVSLHNVKSAVKEVFALSGLEDYFVFVE
ncbi:MAG: STAS domain-containing protein [Treponema sp.]|jgi:anti-anti-sigma factor|nr:STAS domain-containing protein [Treponema sp.]